MAVQTKKPKPTPLDVDRLYSKYKDYETVTINTVDGDFMVNVKIQLDGAGKPYSVILYGSISPDTEINIERMVNNLVEAQTKSGYTETDDAKEIAFQDHYPKVRTLQKGSQYARYGMQRETVIDKEAVARWKKEVDNNPQLSTQLPSYSLERHIGDFFYFEVGDVRRRSNSKQESFAF